MGLLDRIAGTPSSDGNSRETYRSITDADIAGATASADTMFHKAELTGQNDVINISEAIRDGDLILADVHQLDPDSRQYTQFIDDLKRTCTETGSDIVRFGSDHIIITPGTIEISREKL